MSTPSIPPRPPVAGRDHRSPACGAIGDWLASHPVVIFDLDGTLVDTLPDLTGALDEALAALDLPSVHPQVVMNSLHGGLAGTAAAVAAALGLEPTRADALRVAYESAYAAAPALRALPFVGVVDCLASLRQAGCRLGVCTNKGQGDAERVLHSLGLDFAFEVIVGARRGLALKPDAEPLTLAVRVLGGSTRHAVLVGDSIVDAHCARSAGAAFVHFTGGYGGDEALAEPAAARFESYAGLRFQPAAVERDRPTPATGR